MAGADESALPPGRSSRGRWSRTCTPGSPSSDKPCPDRHPSPSRSITCSGALIASRPSSRMGGSASATMLRNGPCAALPSAESLLFAGSDRGADRAAAIGNTDLDRQAQRCRPAGLARGRAGAYRRYPAVEIAGASALELAAARVQNSGMTVAIARLKISLDDVNPKVVRRLAVPFRFGLIGCTLSSRLLFSWKTTISGSSASAAQVRNPGSQLAGWSSRCAESRRCKG